MEQEKDVDKTEKRREGVPERTRKNGIRKRRRPGTEKDVEESPKGPEKNRCQRKPPKREKNAEEVSRLRDRLKDR
jgi:hypothetical protein